MESHRSVHYSAVPKLECWTLPTWSPADRDELDDLLTSLRYYASETTGDSIRAIRIDQSTSIRLCIGTEIPSEADISFQPIKGAKAPVEGEYATGTDFLKEATGFMADRGYREWGRIREDLKAIYEVAIESSSEEELWFSLVYR